MNTISSVNTSFYSELVEGFAPKTTLPVEAVREQDYSQGTGYFSGGEYSEPEVDLSKYYDEVRPQDLLATTGKNLVDSAQTLDNTMVVAMQSGYSVQEVCNIRLAEQAYKANAFVFDVAKDISTFELDV